jgi:hypothetical protein
MLTRFLDLVSGSPSISCFTLSSLLCPSAADSLRRFDTSEICFFLWAAPSDLRSSCTCLLYLRLLSLFFRSSNASMRLSSISSLSLICLHVIHDAKWSESG